MDTTAIPYDSRIVRQLRAREEQAALERNAARIAKNGDLELADAVRHGIVFGSPAGDEQKLRGIPAVGVRGGLGGAVRGSRPGDGLY